MANKHDRAFVEVVTRLYIPVTDLPNVNIDDFLKQAASKIKVHNFVKQSKEDASNGKKQ